MHGTFCYPECYGSVALYPPFLILSRHLQKQHAKRRHFPFTAAKIVPFGHSRLHLDLESLQKAAILDNGQNNAKILSIYLPLYANFAYLYARKHLTLNSNIMKVGIPKEIKQGEYRVGMTPAGVAELVRHGHEVCVQHTAGEGSGFADEEYAQVGATILPTIGDVYAWAEMIIKVKEPIAPEYPLIRKSQLLFTYFHFASDRELTDAMLKSGAVCLAYETVQTADHRLPLLVPIDRKSTRLNSSHP